MKLKRMHIVDIDEGYMELQEDVPDNWNCKPVYVLTEDELKSFIREFLIAAGVLWQRKDMDSDQLVDWLKEQEGNG